MNSLTLMSGGAAKGIVSALQEAFEQETGARIEGTYTAVGAVRDMFVGGAQADILILTEALVADLTRDGLLREGSARAIGHVRTGVAVPVGADVPDISTNDAFAAALRGAGQIYVPDPYLSTAGIYFMSVLDRLGLKDMLTPRLKSFPNGETAMRTMSDARLPGSLGCTQMTEILMTPGLTLIGPLPPEHDLATTYTAAVTTRSEKPDLAMRFIERLTGEGSRMMREERGFEI